MDIKRSTRTIKELVRCGCHYIPYKKFKKINYDIPVTIHDNLLKHVPIQNGISSDLRPSAIILGSSDKDYIKLNITLGEYEQVYKGTTKKLKTENGRGDQNNTIKQTGPVLFYFPSHRKTAPRLYMDRTTHQ